MTFFEVLAAIVRQFLVPDALPYAILVLALIGFAGLWRRKSQSLRQRQLVKTALALWLCVPASVLLGAVFHFAGPNELRGADYNQVAATSVATMLGAVAVGSLVLFIVGSGVRANILANGLALVFVQFWVSLFSACAVVGECV